MQHKKHADLVRPDLGFFHRNEWAILGTPCGKIQHLARQLTAFLANQAKVAYVDADHASGDAPQEDHLLNRGASLEYTDKIHFHRFDINAGFDTYQFRWWFNDQDLVLVNGNHFKAKNQIVVIDPKKEDSLRRKLDRLDNVVLILKTDKEQSIYPFLKDHLEKQQSIADIPVVGIEEVESIGNLLLKTWQNNQPDLFGLVLAGGKSIRMGEDKGAISYHGKPQREYVAELLNKQCKTTYVSCLPEQAIDSKFPLLFDSFTGLGPFGAIASAFRSNPDKAWLVVACDLPLLDKATLQYLVRHRNSSKAATAFQSPVNEFPEPLIAIWEPRSYPILLQFLTQGYSCPRKVLINSDIELLEVENAEALMNVNSPEERDAIRKKLGA